MGAGRGSGAGGALGGEQPARGPVEMAVNLSTRQLTDPELPRRVGAVLARHGFDPPLLTLEITETSLMVGPETAAKALGALKALGVGLAVDDFGTGYSSLTYLRQFPIDELKIDRTFVSGLGINSGDSAIVASCVQLAHAVGIKAVAEGVETEDQREALIGLNCDLAQGYHYARPLPAAELASWFAMESPERTQTAPGAAAL
ncbi:EAL domain-containing protein [Arthrobacter sp. H20]|uniref:EAL domain-containing protein n=1 Tax=Arthrobacter sp. H20 TaxID=1267981 RepID=UPI0020A63AA2|nr:EAL domain-containing protein [Arthrobacter sp. H20]